MQKLQDIAHFQVGFTLARNKATPSSLQSYSYKTLSMNAFPSDGIQMISGHEGLYVCSEKISENYFIKKGDVVIRLRDPIGCIYVSKDEQKLLVSSLAVIVRIEKSKILGEYLAYYLNSSLAQSYFQTKIRGTTIPMIRVADIKQMPIPLPSLKKQSQMIALMQEGDREISFLNELIEQKRMLKHQFFKSLITKE
ncbi:hypothetical protein HpCK38_15940 [Helicobacter pylori]